MQSPFTCMDTCNTCIQRAFAFTCIVPAKAGAGPRARAQGSPRGAAAAPAAAPAAQEVAAPAAQDRGRAVLRRTLPIVAARPGPVAHRRGCARARPCAYL